MKLLHFTALPFLAGVLFTGCATSSVSSPQLQTRLAPEWISSAKILRSSDRTIYYRGQARGSGSGENWAGTVRGDILALDPRMAIVIPSGALTLAPGQSPKIDGPQHVVTSDAPAWKHLLKP